MTPALLALAGPVAGATTPASGDDSSAPASPDGDAFHQAMAAVSAPARSTAQEASRPSPAPGPTRSRPVSARHDRPSAPTKTTSSVPSTTGPSAGVPGAESVTAPPSAPAVALASTPPDLTGGVVGAASPNHSTAQGESRSREGAVAAPATSGRGPASGGPDPSGVDAAESPAPAAPGEIVAGDAREASEVHAPTNPTPGEAASAVPSPPVVTSSDGPEASTVTIPSSAAGADRMAPPSVPSSDKQTSVATKDGQGAAPLSSSHNQDRFSKVSDLVSGANAAAPVVRQAATAVTETTVSHSPSAQGSPAPVSATAMATGSAVSAPPVRSAPAIASTPVPSASTPSQQVVSVLNPLRTSAQGTHQITLRLDPQDLGSVDATVTVRGNQVVVELSVANAVAKQAITAALPQLRHDLGTEGNPATVVLSDSGSGNPQGFQPQSDPTYSHGDAAGLADAEEAVDDQPTTTSPHSIDIRL